MFGMGKKTALIKELVETRLVMRGLDSIDARLFIKSLGSFAAMSLPEATIVIVMESLIIANKKGVPSRLAFERLENTRRMFKSDSDRFQAILSLSDTNDAEAFINYCVYRTEIEAKNDVKLSADEIKQLALIAYPTIISW